MKIVGIAGKKGSGKNTVASYIKKLFYKKYNKDFTKTANIYAFADPLKELCINILGLTYEQCYGTDEQKNSLTKLKWQDMPGIIADNSLKDMLDEGLTDSISKRDLGLFHRHNLWDKYNHKLKYHKHGFMTAREVLQFVGTEIFRHMTGGNCWVEVTLKKINLGHQSLALISDLRFIEEVESIKKMGGLIIYLTRCPFEDNHSSENDLAPDKFDWGKFDCVLYNNRLSINEQEEELNKIVKQLEII